MGQVPEAIGCRMSVDCFTTINGLVALLDSRIAHLSSNKSIYRRTTVNGHRTANSFMGTETHPHRPVHPFWWMVLFLPFGATVGFVQVTIGYTARQQGLGDAAIAEII